MSEWQKGDLALCVRVTHPKFPGSRSSRLRKGVTYTVRKVGKPLPELDGERGLAMNEVETVRPGRGFPETMFVKVTPPKADEFDREVIEAMTGAPVGEPA